MKFQSGAPCIQMSLGSSAFERRNAFTIEEGIYIDRWRIVKRITEKIQLENSNFEIRKLAGFQFKDLDDVRRSAFPIARVSLRTLCACQASTTTQICREVSTVLIILRFSYIIKRLLVAAQSWTEFGVSFHSWKR